MPKTRINVVNCEFMGNEYNMTSGCVFVYSDVVMSSCKFLSFRSGAVFTVSNDEGDVEIKDCEISKCGLVGIYSQGDEAKQFILRCKIDNVEGQGIRVHKANRAKIQGCEISKCVTGIEVLSGDPYIIMNKIRQN
mmetsp:Transcript_40553/g.39077  ORF Transcript_40553/g.39077 Transcript_40553/m.39077 type:complete len:135 (+) Transcript_40553:978-1382(+)